MTVGALAFPLLFDRLANPRYCNPCAVRPICVVRQLAGTELQAGPEVVRSFPATR